MQSLLDYAKLFLYGTSVMIEVKPNFFQIPDLIFKMQYDLTICIPSSMITYLICLLLVEVILDADALMDEEGASNFSLLHDPRSEIHRNVTSGEEDWIFKFERNETVFPSRPTPTGSSGTPFNWKVSEENKNNDSSEGTQIQYKISSMLDRQRRSVRGALIIAVENSILL